MKWAVSLSSLVNISAKFNLPSMCCTVRKSDSTDSLTAFSRICICLSPFVVVALDQHTHALLSLNIGVGVDNNSFDKSKPSMRYERCINCFVHSSVAYISASAELLAVIDCRLDVQCTGPPNQMRYPDIDRDLNNSNSSMFSGVGFDWSCGPQLASHIFVMVWGSGKLRNDSSLWFFMLLNEILSERVALRYLTTRTAASMWPWDGLRQYFARMLVIVAMSGLVDTLIQLRHPTMCCILSVRRF